MKELENLWEFKRANQRAKAVEIHILPLQTVETILLWDWFSLIKVFFNKVS